MIKFGDFTKEKLEILGLMAPMLHYEDLDKANEEVAKGFKYEWSREEKKMTTDLS